MYAVRVEHKIKHKINLPFPFVARSVQALASSLRPLVTQVSEVYGYAPVDKFWDCFQVGNVITIRANIRIPCVCRSVRAFDMARALMRGSIQGVCVAAAAVAAGAVWDLVLIVSALLRGACGGDPRGASLCPFRPPASSADFTTIKKASMLFSATTQLLDEVTDLRVLASYWTSGWMGYFGLSTEDPVLYGSNLGPPPRNIPLHENSSRWRRGLSFR